MKSFTDNTGRTWTLSVTVGTIKRVRALCNVDLAGVISIESGAQPKVDLLERLGSDPVLLVDVLYAVCKPEADALIQEIFRVLRPGGKTIHLIESADYDYLNCNASDPEDPLRKYVHVDGHIGVESPENIKKRFSAFSNLHMRNAMLFPFFTVQGFINNESVFGKEYTDLLRKFSPQEAQAADIVSGFICDYLEKALAAENPANLDPTLERNLPKVFRYGCGKVFLTAEKKLDNVNE